MPLSEIRPGMKGYGKTVFQGGKIERFTFEVLGIQRNSAPGHNIILVKAAGGPLAETGIIQGMSGSPCYIGDRLVGALAIGFAFQKEPIGGITPIEEMLEQLRDIPDLQPSRTPLVLPKLAPPKVLKSALQGLMIPMKEILDLPGSEALPFQIVGSELGSEAKSLWEGLPVRFAGQGVAGSSPGAEASPIEPGGMVAVSLVRGDLEMAATGTITYVSNKKILMFGHPFFNMGSVDLPLHSATVLGLVSNYQTSFKLAQPVAPIGAVRLDRHSGVAGLLGAEARMVPLRLGLNLGGKRTLHFRFELMDNPFLTPLLAATVVSQTLQAHIRGMGLQSLSLQGNIKVANHPAIQIENVVADLNSMRLANYVGGILQAVSMNPYERPLIEGISLTVKAEERLDLTGIAGVRSLKARVKRGEVLPVVVTLQNLQGAREYANFNVNVPTSARPGKATLMVGDGLSLTQADPDERAIEISGIEDMIRLLNGALRNNHAYAILVQAHPGAGLRGSRIEGVPPSVSTLLGGDGDSASNRLQQRILGKTILPLEREVRGLVRLEVEIY